VFFEKLSNPLVSVAKFPLVTRHIVRLLAGNVGPFEDLLRLGAKEIEWLRIRVLLNSKCVVFECWHCRTWRLRRDLRGKRCAGWLGELCADESEAVIPLY